MELTTNEKLVLKKIIVEAMEEVGLLRGKYDKLNGNPHFIYGINTVMEYFAYQVSDDFGEEVSNIFYNNMFE